MCDCTFSIFSICSRHVTAKIYTQINVYIYIYTHTHNHVCVYVFQPCVFLAVIPEMIALCLFHCHFDVSWQSLRWFAMTCSPNCLASFACLSVMLHECSFELHPSLVILSCFICSVMLHLRLVYPDLLKTAWTLPCCTAPCYVTAILCAPEFTAMLHLKLWVLLLFPDQYIQLYVHIYAHICVYIYVCVCKHTQFRVLFCHEVSGFHDFDACL